MPKLKIDNIDIEVPQGTSILQAAEQLGIEIPRFCFHDRLSVPANCRMCLVEVKGGPPKPQASCALACAENMEVFTNSDMVHKARRGVMEFLLINHPLDCPICDQGGECDLQDQAVAYGFDRSRYFEAKRAVKDKELGPLVNTVMTRCIQCTRCIRFSSEIAGVDDLGLINRGEDVEISTFIEKAVESELSGNLVDVCPVGALTSKPYQFDARPWELRKTESVDVLDAVGSNIRIDARGNEVMRVQPRLNEAVNEEWLADKSRYAVDGLKRQRLDRPFVRDEHSGKLREASWEEAMLFTATALTDLKGFQMAALAGDLADAESIFALKELMHSLGANQLECRVDGAQFDLSQPAGYRFNSTIAGIEQADSIVLVATNPRLEAPILNARIRKAWMARGTKVSLIGEKVTLNYPYTHLGTNIDALDKLVKDAKGADKAARPMMIVGMGAFTRTDGAAVHAAVLDAAMNLGCITPEWNGFNVLHTAGGRMGALELGFTPPTGTLDLSNAKAVYLLGVDTDIVDTLPNDAFVIYQGHHGDKGAARADVILPGAAYTEKNATYMNTEGRVQRGQAAVTPVGQAKADWAILRALSETLNRPLPFNTLAELRSAMIQKHPAFGALDAIVDVEAPRAIKAQGKVATTDFRAAVSNYYQTCPVSRASVTMAACVERFGNRPDTAQAA